MQQTPFLESDLAGKHVVAGPWGPHEDAAMWGPPSRVLGLRALEAKTCSGDVECLLTGVGKNWSWCWRWSNTS